MRFTGNYLCIVDEGYLPMYLSGHSVSFDTHSALSYSHSIGKRGRFHYVMVLSWFLAVELKRFTSDFRFLIADARLYTLL